MPPGAARREYRGLIYLAHSARWAYLPAAGTGAARPGGRFNRRGLPVL